ncbi:MAG: chemotaxis protein CheX [Phycisphaerae bacterium]
MSAIPTCAPAPAADPAATPAIVAPFVRSLRDFFQSMLGMTVTIGTPFRKTAQSHANHVSGVIGFSGDLTGAVVIGFPDKVAPAIIEKFAGIQLDETSPDFADAIGEVTNIIAGSAKSGLGLNASISMPSVVIGTGYSVVGLSAVPCYVVPCSCPAGDFSMEISVQQSGPRGPLSTSHR